MLVGYARVSTSDQAAGLEAQERDLRTYGCEKMFAEKVSSVAVRAKLAAALEFVREGDVLVVTKPDRLARNTQELLTIEADLTARKVGLVILSMAGQPLDTRNPTSRLILTILGGVATWERQVMLERQREGIQKAKAEGKYKGGHKTARAKTSDVLRLKDQGMKREDIAETLKIGVASVYRILADARKAA